MDHVDSDVADLTEVPRLFVETHEFGYGACIGSADTSWGDVAR